MTPIVQRLLAVVLPTVVFLGGARLVARIAGEARTARYRAVNERPLNMRWRGYDADDAARVWGLLAVPAPGGGRFLDMERRFLELDLLFPLFYGAANLAGLWLAWHAGGRGALPGAAALPVAVNVVADWAENTLQLRQLARFDAGARLQRGAVAAASLATQVKLAAFSATVVLVIALAARRP